jgi:hypothetical protein
MQSILKFIYRGIGFLVSVGFVIFLARIGWNSLNYICSAWPDVDSGMYSALGLHVLHGYVPYRDIWEQKPPMIFFIEAFALWAAEESVAGIRDIERVCGFIRGIVFFFIVRKAFGSAWLAGVASFVFLAYFYSRNVFQGGNLTEEYATIFLLCGVYASQWARSLVGGRSLLCGALAGFCLSLAALTKEPFVLSAIPWALFVTLRSGGGIRGFLRRAGYMTLGGLLPIFGFIAYFAWHGSLEYWFDAVSFSFGYVSSGSAGNGLWQKLSVNWAYFAEFILSKSMAVNMAACVGIAACLLTPFLKTRNVFIFAVLAEVVLDYYASALSGKGYGHYYMQNIPSFILLAACGVGFIKLAFGRRLPFVDLGFLALIVFGGYRLDRAFFEKWLEDLQAPYCRYEQSEPIVRYIRENSAPSDRMWQASIHRIRRYLEAGRLSPVRFVFLDEGLRVDTILSSGDQKIASITEGLKANPPKFIILSPEESQHFGLTEWVNSTYVDTGVGDGGSSRLFVLASSQQKHP